MNKKVSFDICIELYEKLRKSAYDQNVKISEMIRIIIKDYYSKDKK